MKYLIIVFFLFVTTMYSQIEVIQYNAGWNSTNDVEWVEDLSDCELDYIDIGEKPKQQQKYNIAVVPTIIVFDEGEEIKRYQADISFSMKATKEEIQEFIDEIIANKF
mgnify:FL=1|tara:strand:- start:547 stop:870 length:324 start_codon:yes stop_codon:yes gene_type:complete